jgi:hypothetical protein
MMQESKVLSKPGNRSYQMIRFALLFVIILCGSMMLKAQDVFQPGGKPLIRIFSNYHTTLSGGETANAFELKRAYLGYTHNFSEQFTGQVVLDIGNPGVGKHEMAAYVKNAFLRYSANNLSVNFGMIATTQFKVQESAWGYRYLEKSFQDEYKFNSSADLGVSVAYRIGDILSADVILANGEGYKKIQSDSALRAGIGLRLTPIDGLTGRVYYDYSNKTYKQQSITTFLGFEAERFSVGAEWMKMFNYNFVYERERNGLSFFTTVNASERTKIFARYDNLSSNTISGEATAWDLENDGQRYILGFEYSPVMGIKLAPNFKGWSPSDSSKEFISSFILNCEVKF